MDAFERTDGADTRAEASQAERDEAETLWSAIRADRRARDERTARLRAMRLIGGEDEPG